MIKCPKCQFENREGARFCKECGAKLELACPKCNASITPDSKFCDECGYDLSKPSIAPPVRYSEPQSYTPRFLADKILTTRSSIEGERKLVTVLFADVANYTSIAERIDPEEIHQMMDGCFKILMDEIHRYEGTINQFTGDGVMALFGAPLAHENNAQRACMAALSIQKALGEYGEKIKAKTGAEFRMRIGLNSGPVIVGSIGDDLRMDYTAVGDTTNLAARIQQNTNPGQVWVSQETRNIIRDYFQNKPVGEIQLKGKSRPQPTYCVIAKRPGVRTRFEAVLMRGITEFVGRGPEMESLQAAFKKAKSRDAQIVDVVGEAGVGKSRLVYEFRETLGNEATFLSGICIHYGRNISFLPVIDVVKGAFGIAEGMTEEDVSRRIEDKATKDLASMIPFYRNLLSLQVDDSIFDLLDSEGRKFGTFEAVKELLFAISEKKPLVLFLDDVHWMDKISEELFTYFSRSFVKSPILMIANYRPEGAPAWAQGAHYQRLGLETLSSNSSIRLMRNILGGVALETDLEKKLIERASGNPFFVEETVRELLDRGELVKKEDTFVSIKPIEKLEIPSTIQGVLAARMDRLSEDLKKTIQVASVIGRDFAFRLLKNTMELGDELRSHLTNLVGLEILYEKVLYPELEYIFKHALTQEVAYESLLKQRRKELHGRIAQAIEEIYAHQLEVHYELLAYHYERSGNQKKAIDYLILAGEKSNLHSAAQTACDFFEKALKVAEKNNIVLDAKAQIRIHTGLSTAYIEIGAVGKSVEACGKAIDLSRQHGFIDYEKENLFAYCFLMHSWPVKAEAERILKEGIARAQQMGDKALESTILSSTGTRMILEGRPRKAKQIHMEAAKMAEEAGDPQVIGYANAHRSVSERWFGRPQKAIELTEGIAEIAREMFNMTGMSYVVFTRGIALAETGRIEDGIAILKDGIDVCEKFGVSIRLASLYNCLGYCYGEIHNTEHASALNQRGEEIARSLLKKYPMGRYEYAEMLAQSRINLMENYFDQSKLDEAWNGIQSFRIEAKGDDFKRFRHQWESRLNYLAAQILLIRNDTVQADTIIQENLKLVKDKLLKKRQGCFIRLTGELLLKQNEFENALNYLRESVHLLEEVGNPRQLWQAYASLASAFKKAGRTGEASENWGLAAHLINKTADRLSENELKSGFLNADPIKKILSNSGA
ncbi:MAG: adenylate/guanylate cyclase domain-containing protein [Deltaproteobacteria bacterium]